MRESHVLKLFLILHMAIHVDHLMIFNISIKFTFEIKIVMFLRGRPQTPIDPAPVLLHCSTSHSAEQSADQQLASQPAGQAVGQPAS